MSGEYATYETKLEMAQRHFREGLERQRTLVSKLIPDLK